MSRWFRVYDDLVDDPKVQRLPGDLIKALLNIWCLTSQNDGVLPPLDVVAFKLRMKPAKLDAVMTGLRNAGLLDQDDTGIRPHNWNARQFKSDVSNDRVKRHRERKCNVTETVTATPPDTESDNRSRKEEPADAGLTSNCYAFESGIIRLNQRDFDRWKANYTHLDLGAELLGVTEWANQQGPQRWFNACQGLLAKKNREAKANAERAKNAPAFKWKSGIEGVI